jgi:hypothetical protein
MQYNIVYYVVYDIVCFCPSSLEALGSRVYFMMNYAFLIAFLLIHTKVT